MKRAAGNRPLGRVRPTGTCGRGRGGRSAPCGRRRWPCGRGSRGGACERASWVDRSASRSCLQVLALQCARPASSRRDRAASRAKKVAALSRRREARLCREGQGKSIEGSLAHEASWPSATGPPDSPRPGNLADPGPRRESFENGEFSRISGASRRRVICSGRPAPGNRDAPRRGSGRSPSAVRLR